MENDAILKTLILCYVTPKTGYYMSLEYLEEFNKFILIGSDLDTLDDIAYFLEIKSKKVYIFENIDQLISGPEATILNDLNTHLTIV
ncbi:Uncharacterised protein [Sphingobacterium multivorum]|uniref:hypothetical protein n=2 Tax=Sphingobacterium multivorum TaxID=28454 RepID=UPI000E038FA4|nr:hypothetical protein [Sphingobacterium multivorum]QQT46632.1 hypothetical protein I6J00_08240 [Sphingobacterium multivorum]SUJ89400.1 Uncharacterised protein [Sphingobacterium multivorum]